MTDAQKNLDNLDKQEVNNLEQIVKETEPDKAVRADQRALDKEIIAEEDSSEEHQGAVDAMWGDEMRGN